MYYSGKDRDKLFERLKLCKQQIKASKAQIAFWSYELNMVVEALVDSDQLKFDNLDNQSEVPFERK